MAGIRNTTLADPNAAPCSPGERAAFSVERAATLSLAAICGIGLLWFAVPRAVAAFVALPGQPTREAIQRGAPTDPDSLRLLAEAAIAAAEWDGAPSHHVERGVALLKLAAGTGGSRPDPWLLESAIAALRTGLGRAPANRSAWLQLAVAEYLRSGSSAAVARALRMSIMAGRHDPALVFLRLDVALRNWRYVEPRDRSLVFAQVRQAGSASLPRLVAVTRGRQGLAIVRAALASDPGALQRFEAARKRATTRRR